MAEPIKRHPHIVPLSKQHHDALLFCWKIRKGIKDGISSDRLAKYSFWFWENHLVPHFKDEEKWLFSNADDVLVKQALDEHIVLMRLFTSMTDENTLPNFDEVANLLDNHVRFEERVLFPHLEKNMSESELEIVGNALHKHAACANDYSDQFWLKNKE